jgi:hypothetical protein
MNGCQTATQSNTKTKKSPVKINLGADVEAW